MLFGSGIKKIAAAGEEVARMLFLLRYSARRIPREGFKGLTVPALCLVLVILINMMGNAGMRLAYDLEDVLDNFEVLAEVSDPATSAVDGLGVNQRYISLFTDPGAASSLAAFLKDVRLSRQLNFVPAPPGGSGGAATADGPDSSPDGGLAQDSAPPGFGGDSPPAGEAPVQPGLLIGISSIDSSPGLSPLSGAYVEFFEGYDEGMFRTEEFICIVSEETYSTLDPEHPVIALSVQSTALILQETETLDGDGQPVRQSIMAAAPFVDASFLVVGLTYGAGNDIYCPFWAAGALGMESDGSPLFSDILSALVADNRRIGEFKEGALRHFVAPGVISERLPFSLTVFDGVFNDITHRLRQNILMIEIATPFVYFISVCIGFITSFLLTRHRKPEFAMMRSIGAGKAGVFACALAEQAALSLAGVAAGSVTFYALSGDAAPWQTLIFWGCYLSGSALSAIKAAGTDVLKILRAQ